MRILLRILLLIIFWPLFMTMSAVFLVSLKVIITGDSTIVDILDLGRAGVLAVFFGYLTNYCFNIGKEKK